MKSTCEKDCRSYLSVCDSEMKRTYIAPEVFFAQVNIESGFAASLGLGVGGVDEPNKIDDLEDWDNWTD